MNKAEFLSKRLMVDSFGDIDINRLAQCAPETCENITYDANGNVTSAKIKGITDSQLAELAEIPAVIIDDDLSRYMTDLLQWKILEIPMDCILMHSFIVGRLLVFRLLRLPQRSATVWRR